MKIIEMNNLSELKKNLMLTSVVLFDTDTIIGLSCSAYSKDAIERINHIKNRDKNKSYIRLVSSIEMVQKFCNLSKYQNEILLKNWPNKISFILIDKFTGDKIIFRWTKNKFINDFVNIFGPIITTSANISNMQAPSSFKDVSNEIINKVDFYVSFPKDHNLNLDLYPSTIVDISEDKTDIVRQGKYKLIL